MFLSLLFPYTFISFDKLHQGTGCSVGLGRVRMGGSGGVDVEGGGHWHLVGQIWGPCVISFRSTACIDAACVITATRGPCALHVMHHTDIV